MTSSVRLDASTAEPTGGVMAFDPEATRRDFPILSTTVRGHPLSYLDNAATSQKPQSVIDAVSKYYASQNANIHRGVYQLSEVATALYDATREKARRFLNAPSSSEIVFVRGTTDAINLAASSLGQLLLGPRDEVLVSAMEHHSNIVPWQMACQKFGATLRVIPMNNDGELELDQYRELLNDRTKIVAFGHVSNALGTVNPVELMSEWAHEHGAVVVVDGAQAAPHLRVDVQALDVDFYTVSGHKMFGPTGTGLLYGKSEWLEAMPPYQGGGDMIRSVSFEETTYAPIPAKFEAGTPDIAGVVGLGATFDYIGALPWDEVEEYEDGLVAYAMDQLQGVHGLSMVGAAKERVAVLSFVLEGVHAHDVGTILDQQGVAIRTGHHCAQPVMDFYGVPATARASFAFYNTRDDIDCLVRGLGTVREVFG